MSQDRLTNNDLRQPNLRLPIGDAQESVPRAVATGSNDCRLPIGNAMAEGKSTIGNWQSVIGDADNPVATTPVQTS